MFNDMCIEIEEHTLETTAAFNKRTYWEDCREDCMGMLECKGRVQCVEMIHQHGVSIVLLVRAKELELNLA